MSNFKPGQVIRFTYNAPIKGNDDPTDRFKEILVLHPNWMRLVHGIDLKRLTAAEREVLDAIFDPKQKGKQHRMPLVNDILRRMNPIDEIKNPVSFYSKFVKVFLRNKDAYRTYQPERILNATIVEQTNVSGNVINPKPLFHKVESKAPPNRLDLIRQRATAQSKGSTNVKTIKPKVKRAPKPK